MFRSREKLIFSKQVMSTQHYIEVFVPVDREDHGKKLAYHVHPYSLSYFSSTPVNRILESAESPKEPNLTTSGNNRSSSSGSAI